jgi:predicted Rossmann fold nucleotide-binding protein DprA/Smf involved in DNA uptake
MIESSFWGNNDLLIQSKIAFLASSTIPTDMVLCCYDWAQHVSRGSDCIVSGFSSYLEQRVLHFLVKGTCPIILVLGRKMYKRVPEELRPLLDKGRLLIISTTKATRQSRTTAYARNQYICELVDKIIMVGVNEGSSLSPLKDRFSSKLCSI